MKRIAYLTSIVHLVLWVVSSCHTIRQKVKREENSHFQYAQMALSSDSIVRRWYFFSDSAFSYHPDSGLRTLSGLLLGWERSVNQKLEQQTVDSVEKRTHEELKVVCNDGKMQLVGYSVMVLIVGIFIIAFRVAKRR